VFAWPVTFESILNNEINRTMTDIDPELNYCPDCQDEYRADFDHCASCDVQLISGAMFIEIQKGHVEKKLERPTELSTEDDLVSLRSGSLQDMKQLRSLLAAEHIPSLLVSEDGGCSKSCCGSTFFLQIREQDAQDALAVLAHDFHKSTALHSHDLSNTQVVYDNNAGKATCPACGCQFTPTTMTCPDCGLCFG